MLILLALRLCRSEEKRDWGLKLAVARAAADRLAALERRGRVKYLKDSLAVVWGAAVPRRGGRDVGDGGARTELVSLEGLSCREEQGRRAGPDRYSLRD